MLLQCSISAHAPLLDAGGVAREMGRAGDCRGSSRPVPVPVPVPLPTFHGGESVQLQAHY